MPELVTAFHVLGMDVKQAEVNAIMAEASPAGNTHMEGAQVLSIHFPSVSWHKHTGEKN